MSPRHIKNHSKHRKKRSFAFIIVAMILMVLYVNRYALAGERLIIQLKDFTQTEVKSGGFNLPSHSSIHIKALGAGGEKNFPFSKVSLFAYGWIINADTRELVWRMDRNNTKKEKDDRKFDGTISLPKGSYEVYYSVYGYFSSSSFSTFDINIDRRKENSYGNKSKRRGFFEWFENFFGEDAEKDWARRAKNWNIELFVDDRVSDVQMFTPPKEMPNVIYKSTQAGENKHVRQPFVLTKPTAIRVYALGEMGNGNSLADYGWIVNAKTRKREWQMLHNNTTPAGGANKNEKADEIITLPSGEYTLYYITDDSHSYVDWNSPPPDDPVNYGITLMVQNESDKGNFKLISKSSEDKNVIVQLIRTRRNETRNENFSLKEDAPLHVYALGEGGLSGHKMADYGWIMDTRTRQRVWTMDIDRTEHAGGAEKNRIIDEVVTLPKGDYSVFYKTDDSHSYDDWNSSPPFDPEHWGITLSGVGDNFIMNTIEKNPARQSGVVAQIIHVGDNAKRTVTFKVDQPTRVKIYAIGEGQNREMFDYGWIENDRTSTVVWELTYSMTFHAGGGRKNRMVNTTLLLDKGEYTLHYVTDDSHSYDDWNSDPPDDPTMWGITVFLE